VCQHSSLLDAARALYSTCEHLIVPSTSTAASTIFAVLGVDCYVHARSCNVLHCREQDMMVGLQPSEDSVAAGTLVEHADTSNTANGSPHTAGAAPCLSLH
jgi:hypothetical protein